MEAVVQQVEPYQNRLNFAAIDASGLYYRELNQKIRKAISEGVRRIDINNVTGQRYIGTNVYDCPGLHEVEIRINGVPGNDLGAFLNGPRIVIHGNAQDGLGNTMNAGEIIVHGNAGDISGFSARGGRIMIKGSAGYRVGIHMKEYQEKKPALVIGGTFQDFLGEYMAGGVIAVLGIGIEGPHKGGFIGTGMHGGVIYIRGEFDEKRMGREVGVEELTDIDWQVLKTHVRDYCRTFDCDEKEILSSGFKKLIPVSLRPYGNMYAY